MPIIDRQTIIDETIRQSKILGINPDFALAVFEHESALRQQNKKGGTLKGPALRDSKGRLILDKYGNSIHAYGVAQVLESTAALYGIKNVYNYKLNIRAGLLYLQDLIKRNKNNVYKVLRAYGGFKIKDPKYYIASIRRRWKVYALSGRTVIIKLTKADIDYLERRHR